MTPKGSAGDALPVDSRCRRRAASLGSRSASDRPPSTARAQRVQTKQRQSSPHELQQAYRTVVVDTEPSARHVSLARASCLEEESCSAQSSASLKPVISDLDSGWAEPSSASETVRCHSAHPDMPRGTCDFVCTLRLTLTPWCLRHPRAHARTFWDVNVTVLGKDNAERAAVCRLIQHVEGAQGSSPCRMPLGTAMPHMSCRFTKLVNLPRLPLRCHETCSHA